MCDLSDLMEIDEKNTEDGIHIRYCEILDKPTRFCEILRSKAIEAEILEA